VSPSAVVLPPKLRLVPLSADWATNIVSWRNAPENRRFFLSGGELTLPGQLAWTERQLRDRRDHTFIALRETTPVGMVGIYGIDPVSRSAEYGRILIDPGWRRRGLGRAVTSLALAHGFAALDLDLIFANCVSDNLPILALLQELGFRPTGRWRHDAPDREVTRLELPAAAWEASPWGRVCAGEVPQRVKPKEEAKPAGGAM
jgi:RimJ/RimL family protein N-acetyltransferase